MRLLRPRICDDHSGPARGCGQDSGKIVGEVSSSWTLRNFPEIVNQLDKCRDLDLADSRFDRRSPNIVNSIGYTTRSLGLREMEVGPMADGHDNNQSQ